MVPEVSDKFLPWPQIFKALVKGLTAARAHTGTILSWYRENDGGLPFLIFDRIFQPVLDALHHRSYLRLPSFFQPLPERLTLGLLALRLRGVVDEIVIPVWRWWVRRCTVRRALFRHRTAQLFCTESMDNSLGQDGTRSNQDGDGIDRSYRRTLMKARTPAMTGL